MNKIITIVIFIVFLIGNAFGQSANELKSFSIKELNNDIDSLTKYIEETHPIPLQHLQMYV